jgi:hypothetical protein
MSFEDIECPFCNTRQGVSTKAKQVTCMGCGKVIDLQELLSYNASKLGSPKTQASDSANLQVKTIRGWDHIGTGMIVKRVSPVRGISPDSVKESDEESEEQAENDPWKDFEY